MNDIDPWVIMDKLRKQHSDEIHNIWRPLVADIKNQLESITHEYKTAEMLIDIKDERIERLSYYLDKAINGVWDNSMMDEANSLIVRNNNDE